MLYKWHCVKHELGDDAVLAKDASLGPKHTHQPSSDVFNDIQTASLGLQLKQMLHKKIKYREV